MSWTVEAQTITSLKELKGQQLIIGWSLSPLWQLITDVSGYQVFYLEQIAIANHHHTRITSQAQHNHLYRENIIETVYPATREVACKADICNCLACIRDVTAISTKSNRTLSKCLAIPSNSSTMKACYT